VNIVPDIDKAAIKIVN